MKLLFLVAAALGAAGTVNLAGAERKTSATSNDFDILTALSKWKRYLMLDAEMSDDEKKFHVTLTQHPWKYADFVNTSLLHAFEAEDAELILHLMQFPGANRLRHTMETLSRKNNIEYKAEFFNTICVYPSLQIWLPQWHYDNGVFIFVGDPAPMVQSTTNPNMVKELVQMQLFNLLSCVLLPTVFTPFYVEPTVASRTQSILRQMLAIEDWSAVKSQPLNTQCHLRRLSILPRTEVCVWRLYDALHGLSGTVAGELDLVAEQRTNLRRTMDVILRVHLLPVICEIVASGYLCDMHENINVELELQVVSIHAKERKKKLRRQLLKWEKSELQTKKLHPIF